MPAPPTTQHDRAATPTAFPDSGTFGVSQMVTLLCATPGAAIHYTNDGSAPSTVSPVFDPYQLPVLAASDEAGTYRYVLRALAARPDLEPSEVATFHYTLERRARDRYQSREIGPGLFMILDYDDTKMYLVLGRERALFIDAGLGGGDLRGFVEGMIGALPLEVVITHGHPDHIACMAQFQGRYPVYMNDADLPLIQRFNELRGYGIDPAQIIDLHEGAVFDLGERAFTVYEVPGHSAGSVVLFDHAAGLLIAGDALGSNRPTITDSLWMQMPGMARIDNYLSTLQGFRSKLAGQIKETYGGHNDAAIRGETYLDNLQQAAQTLVDQGEVILVPSLRPTTAWQVIVGDRLTDPNWAAINVARGSCLTCPPEQMATLSNLQLRAGALAAAFRPDRLHYTAEAAGSLVEITPTTTSSHSRLTINGAPWRSGAAYAADMRAGENRLAIAVVSPDGKVTKTYTLNVLSV